MQEIFHLIISLSGSVDSDTSAPLLVRTEDHWEMNKVSSQVASNKTPILKLS